MPENELNDLLVTEKERLVKMKMSHAVSPMENPLQIKFTRKTIARVMTEISKRRNTSK
jgi:large subunit ribosomal protein L29